MGEGGVVWSMGGTGGGCSVMVMLFGGDRSYDGRRGQPWANHVDDVLRCAALTLRTDARARRSTKWNCGAARSAELRVVAAGELVADASTHAHIDGCFCLLASALQAASPTF